MLEGILYSCDVLVFELTLHNSSVSKVKGENRKHKQKIILFKQVNKYYPRVCLQEGFFFNLVVTVFDYWMRWGARWLAVRVYAKLDNNSV